ncbi:MAG: hypothetical protein AAF827_13795 [Cyanobacteria bacterium P01_D01_bin.6]
MANREVEATREEIHQGIRQAQTQAIAQRTLTCKKVEEMPGLMKPLLC